MEGWLARLEAIVHYLTSLDLHQVGAHQFSGSNFGLNTIFMSEKNPEDGTDKSSVIGYTFSYWTYKTI
jgi:hypothetical protein